MEFLGAFTHPTNLAVQSSKRSFQLPVKVLDGEIDGLGLQDRMLKLGEKHRFEGVGTFFHAVRASSPIKVLRTAVSGMIEFATARHDDHIRTARTALHKTRQEVRAGKGFGRKSRFIAAVVMLLYDRYPVLDPNP